MEKDIVVTVIPSRAPKSDPKSSISVRISRWLAVSVSVGDHR